MLLCMTSCSYCNKPATATILANPHRVCLEHAVEFWTGLLDYTRGRSGPCVKHEMMCECPLCLEMDASLLRASAIAGASASPGDHVGFSIGLAS